MPVLQPTKDKALIGAAGVHFVAAALSLRGLIALPTVRNTAGIDIVAVNTTGTWVANIQVKTSRSRVGFWPVSENFEHWTQPNNHYVFVRYVPKLETFEAFAETSVAVARQLRRRLKDEERRGLKKWAPCWYLEGKEGQLADQWARLGADRA